MKKKEAVNENACKKSEKGIPDKELAGVTGGGIPIGFVRGGKMCNDCGFSFPSGSKCPKCGSENIK